MRDVGHLDVNPPYFLPDHPISWKWAPSRALVELPRAWFQRLPGPAFSRIQVAKLDNDLTAQHDSHPIGQRIILSGRVVDSSGRGVPNTLLEIWQVNSAGAYADPADPGYCPLDPNFTGAGRCLTDPTGAYRFVTIRPASYLGIREDLSLGLENHSRTAHIHFSVFGQDLASRLITQCYFADDPLLVNDPLVQSFPDPSGTQRLTARFQRWSTQADDNFTRDGNEAPPALLYHWDIVLRGHNLTPITGSVTDDQTAPVIPSPSQSIGPLFGFSLMFPGSENAVEPDEPDSVRIRGRVFKQDGPAVFPDGMLEIWEGDQFARTRTGPDGVFTAVLKKPARRLLVDGRLQAPHLNVTVFSSGLIKQAQTRMYFPDEETANATDPVLARVAPDVRHRLVARQEADDLVFDIRFQGDDESIFFSF